MYQFHCFIEDVLRGFKGARLLVVAYRPTCYNELYRTNAHYTDVGLYIITVYAFNVRNYAKLVHSY